MQEHVRKPNRSTSRMTRKEYPEDREGRSGQERKRGEEIKEEMDEILDEIDEVLEENAEEFVAAYRQANGE